MKSTTMEITWRNTKKNYRFMNVLLLRIFHLVLIAVCKSYSLRSKCKSKRTSRKRHQCMNVCTMTNYSPLEHILSKKVNSSKQWNDKHKRSRLGFKNFNEWPNTWNRTKARYLNSHKHKIKSYSINLNLNKFTRKNNKFLTITAKNTSMSFLK